MKIAFRNLWRNKLYTTLNVVGLTFGLSCFLIIGLYLYDELTYDQQHGQSDHIFRVIEHRNTPTENTNIAAINFKLSEEAPKVISEIDKVGRISQYGRDNLANIDNQKKFLEDITVANNGFMEIFDFEAVDGNPKTALIEPASIVLVESLALKLFGEVNVVGRILKWDGFDVPFTITAVIKNHPGNSSFNFNVLYSESTYYSDTSYINDVGLDWSSNDYVAFTLLKPNSRPEKVSQKLDDIMNANFKQEIGTSKTYSLQTLNEMHLHSSDIKNILSNSSANDSNIGSFFYIKIFAFIALFILLIACINYMNLTTAKAANRSKEIGIKKTVGVLRNQLIAQFLIESVLVTFISFIFSVFIVNVTLTYFNEFANKELSLGFSTNYQIWLGAIVVFLTTGLLSGVYPAFMLSRYNPVLLLKSIKIPIKSDFSLRKNLVVFQFTISVVMIIATIVLLYQVKYLNNKDLGFNKDLLLVVDINSGKIRQSSQTIVSEFSKIPTVKNVSATSRVPGEWKNIPTVKINSNKSINETKISYFLGVDEHFTETFEMKLLKGRNFSGLTDTSSVIINETAANMLNISEPTDQILEIPERAMGGTYRSLPSNQIFKARVIGIIGDFHFQSLREKIAPVVLGYQQNPIHNIDYFTSRIEAKDIAATLKRMEQIISGIDEDDLFEFHFLDQQLALFYAEDSRRQSMLIWAALATILIACLGLFGLATFTAEQRVKEIGVRKVLGASIPNLATLLSKDFLKLVLIANGIAFPIAWWATDKWLQEFAYHIEIKWWFFALAGMLSILIAVLTVSYQAVKTALVNPVKSLRTE